MTGLLWKCFTFVVLFVAVGGASVANASSYLRLDGVTVDPIQNTYGGDNSYTGPNLEPGVVAPGFFTGNPSPGGGYINGASLEDADLTLGSLDHADLSGASLGNADLSSADLSFASLSGAYVVGADFSGANLRHSDLTWTLGGKSQGTFFVGADLTGADLSNSKYRVQGKFTNANLSGTDWFNAFVSGVDFTNAILVAADLSNAVDLQAADLTGATYSTGSLSNRTLFPAGFDPVARGMVLVPEVSTSLMVGIGLVGMALKGKKRKRVR